MRVPVTLLLLFCLSTVVHAQQPASQSRLTELERRLDQATESLERLGETIRMLRSEISIIKAAQAVGNSPTLSQASVQPAPEDAHRAFIERVIEPELGSSERGEALSAKPEIFIQSRYSAVPIRDAGSEFEPNISLTRVETRWAGRVTNRLGAGLEIQFHPAIDGSPEELVNDAFVEFYLNEHTTIRVGQFIKPFGFDIQQSSSVRESPERAIFAGYFFPGQRDRGFMLSGDLNFADSAALRNVHYFIGAFNGNRFFTDNNRQLNYVFRLRKVLDRPKLAVGFSVQQGNQILPDNVSGDGDEDLYGVDIQYALGRFGIRGEIVGGNTPSTLLGIEPEFAPAFSPGLRSAGGAVTAMYGLSVRDNVYARYDRFNRDPVSGLNVQAFNFGYFRDIGEQSRLSFDYQFKNRPSFNDDAVNGRLQLTWGIEF